MVALLLGATSISSSARAETPGPTVNHQVISRVKPGSPVEFHALITSNSASAVFNPVLYFRTKGASHFSRISLEPVANTPHLFSTIVAKELVIADFDYYLEAYDEDGNGPSQVGNDKAPLHVLVTNEAAPVADANGKSVKVVFTNKADKPNLNPPDSKKSTMVLSTSSAASSSSSGRGLGIGMTAGGGAAIVAGAILLGLGVKDYNTDSSVVFDRPGAPQLTDTQLNSLRGRTNAELWGGGSLAAVGLAAVGIGLELIHHETEVTTHVGVVREDRSHNPELADLIFGR
jgi:hypothetical protein